MDKTLLNNVFNSGDLYPPAQDGIHPLPGKGVAITPDQFNTHDQNKKKPKEQHIAFCGFFHKGIYNVLYCTYIMTSRTKLSTT